MHLLGHFAPFGSLGPACAAAMALACAAWPWPGRPGQTVSFNLEPQFQASVFNEVWGLSILDIQEDSRRQLLDPACVSPQIGSGRLPGRLPEDDGKTAGDCGKTTRRRREDCGKTLPQDYGKTLPQHSGKTTGRLQEDCRNTTGRLLKTSEDDRKEGYRKRTWFLGLLVC